MQNEMRVEQRPDSKVAVFTTCCVCGKEHETVVDYNAFRTWYQGALIQNVFPDLNPAEREILISGTCDECFNAMFPPDEEEE